MSEIRAIDHVQLAMPAGGEPEARAFYGGVLGLLEVPKPASIAGRGGCWFEAGAVRVHLGVEAQFRPAQKAHVAFAARPLEDLILRARAAGVTVEETVQPDGFRQTYCRDPFGNRIELVAAD